MLLLYSFFLPQQTRRDSVQAFLERDIVEHGAYGIMQAHAAMREILFRLGYMPKYGA
jgi:hypothetical protein